MSRLCKYKIGDLVVARLLDSVDIYAEVKVGEFVLLDDGNCVGALKAGDVAVVLATSGLDNKRIMIIAPNAIGWVFGTYVTHI